MAEWHAVITDRDGFVMSEEDVQLWATDTEKAERLTSGPPVQLVIVTGSAAPIPQSNAPDEKFYRLPAYWTTADRFLDIDLVFDFGDPDVELLTLWNRAQAAVAGMNAAGVA